MAPARFLAVMPKRRHAIAAHAVGLEKSAEEWVQLLPAGTFHGADGRGPWTLTDPEAVVAASRGLGDLPIDYDHATDLAAPEGRRAPAAGWIQELEVRNQGEIWGRVEWTDKGAAAVAAREYRFLSPVFEHELDSGRVARIRRAALTNNPALTMKALSSQEAPMTLAQRLAKLLGLADDSNDEAILAAANSAITENTQRGSLLEAICKAAESKAEDGAEKIVIAIQAKAKADPAKFVPIEAHQAVVTELNTMKTTHADNEATAKVEAAMQAGKITPAMKDWALDLCKQSTKAFDAFVEKQPEIVPESERKLETKPHAGEGALDDEDVAICAQLGISQDNFKKTRAAASA